MDYRLNEAFWFNNYIYIVDNFGNKYQVKGVKQPSPENFYEHPVITYSGGKASYHDKFIRDYPSFQGILRGKTNCGTRVNQTCLLLHTEWQDFWDIMIVDRSFFIPVNRLSMISSFSIETKPISIMTLPKEIKVGDKVSDSVGQEGIIVNINESNNRVLVGYQERGLVLDYGGAFFTPSLFGDGRW